MAHSVYQPNPTRIFFGVGCIEGLAGETERLKLARSVIICSPARTGVAEGLAAAIGSDKAIIVNTHPHFEA
jgi:alcohol dehydrogenase class IV